VHDSVSDEPTRCLGRRTTGREDARQRKKRLGMPGERFVVRDLCTRLARRAITAVERHTTFGEVSDNAVEL
jgi:hypothetical protein